MNVVPSGYFTMKHLHISTFSISIGLLLASCHSKIREAQSTDLVHTKFTDNAEVDCNLAPNTVFSLPISKYKYRNPYPEKNMTLNICINAFPAPGTIDEEITRSESLSQQCLINWAEHNGATYISPLVMCFSEPN